MLQRQALTASCVLTFAVLQCPTEVMPNRARQPFVYRRPAPICGPRRALGVHDRNKVGLNLTVQTQKKLTVRLDVVD